jgi:hypothetical protein
MGSGLAYNGSSMIDFKAKTMCSHVVSSVRYTLAACPRCGGAGFYYDISFDVLGNIATIERQEKLAQEINKIFIEQKRASGYGFNLASLIGSTEFDYSKTRIEYEVLQALNYLSYLQQYAKRSGKSINPSEEINAINSVTAVQNDNDPRIWHIIVSVTTQSGLNVSSALTTELASSFSGADDSMNGTVTFN